MKSTKSPLAALDKEPKSLLAALDKERNKFDRSDSAKMQEIIDQLIENGTYPFSTWMLENGSTHLSMVEGYGAMWFQWSAPLNCPHCGTDLRDHVHGPPFKREIGIEGMYDRVDYYKCPDCGQKISRLTAGDNK